MGILKNTAAMVGASAVLLGAILFLAFSPTTSVAEASGGSHTPPPTPTCEISANPTTVSGNQNPTLSWSSTHATSAVLNQGIGPMPVNGSIGVYPDTTTTYTLTVYGQGGSAQCSTTVTVSHAEPSCTITADDTSLTQGESTTLRWDTENVSSVSLTQFGSIPFNGTISTGALYSTKTYVLNVWGAGGSSQCTVTIGVIADESDAPSCDIWADDEWIENGQGTSLSWSSQDASSATLTQFGSVSVTGSRWTGALYGDKTYTLTVSGNGGTAHCSVTINVDEDDYHKQPSCSIWFDEEWLEEGDSTTIHWSSDNATSATLSNVGSVSVDGSRWTETLYSTRTYTLTVWGEGGSAQCSETVTVSDGSDDYYDEEEPSCWIRATTDYSGYGYNEMTLTWGSENATSASISPNIGSVSTHGSRSVYGGAGTYTMTVWGDNGSATCRTQTRYTPPAPPYIPPQQPYIPPQPPIVYQPQQPVYQPPMYQQPVVQTYVAPRTYTAPIALRQIPYTGFELGDFGTAMYWFSITLVAFCGVVALAYYRSDVLSLSGIRMFRRETQSARLKEFRPDESLTFSPIRHLA